MSRPWNFGKNGWQCDFCGHKDAPEMWFYPHKPFKFFFVPLQSDFEFRDDAMAACELCHLAIDADNYADLVRMATETTIGVMGKGLSFMPELLSRAYNMFRANRIGGPVRVTKQC